MAKPADLKPTETSPAPSPPGKIRGRVLGRRIGMTLCAVFGLAVAIGPGVEGSQRILGALFFLACGLPVLWMVLRRR